MNYFLRFPVLKLKYYNRINEKSVHVQEGQKPNFNSLKKEVRWTTHTDRMNWVGRAGPPLENAKIVFIGDYLIGRAIDGGRPTWIHLNLQCLAI